MPNDVMFPQDMFPHDFSRYYLWSLGRHIPFLVVFAVGIILAIVFRRRCPMACMFMLAGCTVKVMAHLVHPFFRAHLFMNRDLFGGRMTAHDSIMGAMEILDAVAYGLLFTAVLVGRPLARPNKQTA